MLVEIKKRKNRSVSFQYTIGDDQVTSLAGDILCRLLDFQWEEFVYVYGLYLHTGDDKYLLHVEKAFSELGLWVQKLIGNLFPPTTQALGMIKKISEVLRIVSKKIDANEASFDYASYEYFRFIFTNFYDYKSPAFPIQQYNVPILSFIIPLIDEHCPITFYKNDYTQLIDQIDNVTNVMSLEKLLLELRNLLSRESQKNQELPYPNARLVYHYKTISGIIEWYCMLYVDGTGSYYYQYDPIDLLDSEFVDQVDQQELEKVNKATTISLLQRLCNEEGAPYKFFLMDLLYSYNTSTTQNTYYLDNAFDLICHAVLFCFNESLQPIVKCKCCRKYYPREENSQKYCRNCNDLIGRTSNGKIKEIFGIDPYGVINNIYRRLCYGKDGRLSYDKYNIHESSESNDMLLTPEQSKKLVKELKYLKNDLSQVVRSAITRYHGYRDQKMKTEYTGFVKAWVEEINRYYTLELIKDSIIAAKAHAEQNRLPNLVLKIKKIGFNTVHIEEQIIEIILPPTKGE